jgi:nitrogen fixation NifU-like protein
MAEMYTERLLDHYRHPRNKGLLPEASGSGLLLSHEEYNPLCGDRVTVQVLVRDDKVVDARFEGRGCALSLGAASILTELVRGRDVKELRAMDRDGFLSQLESEVRTARLKCALLPWVAFRRALFDENIPLD